MRQARWERFYKHMTWGVDNNKSIEQQANMQTYITYLRPSPSSPLGRAGHSVAGLPAFWLLSTAVLAVDRAVCALMEELHTTNCSDLKSQAAAGFSAMLPLFRDPPGSIQTKIDLHQERTRLSLYCRPLQWFNISSKGRQPTWHALWHWGLLTGLPTPLPIVHFVI